MLPLPSDIIYSTIYAQKNHKLGDSVAIIYQAAKIKSKTKLI